MLAVLSRIELIKSVEMSEALIAFYGARQSGEDNKDSLIAIAGGMHQYTYVIYKNIFIP